MKKISLLNRFTILFPLALVLFEFTVYIANDMIQPAMPAVVQEFGVSSAWIPTALTAFLIGGGTLTWLLGPLSDRYGRRPVMLAGSVLFALSCVAILFSSSIENFIMLRVFQGMGMCFIGAVGYAAIQEAFEEAAAIKVMALMANVSLIAPLIGPFLGALLISIAPWRIIFVLIGLLAVGCVWGLWRHMPETVDAQAQAEAIHQDHFVIRLLKEYKRILTQGSFVRAALVPPLLALPILGWIGVGPLVLMSHFNLTPLAFSMWQIPVFTCLIAGNLILAKVTGRWALDKTLKIGLILIAVAAVIALFGGIFLSNAHLPLVIATSLTALGEGLSFSVYYRFALTASTAPKGLAAAAVNLFFTVVFAAGVELYKIMFLQAGLFGYALLTALLAILVCFLARISIAEALTLRQTAEDTIA
jgi:MFS transporter, DHA1 family, multidrug/chloramphenicol efflux transport protein